jgi:hypothetical protein
MRVRTAYLTKYPRVILLRETISCQTSHKQYLHIVIIIGQATFFSQSLP